ncbi:putative Ralf-like 34 [Hibiscus syriacus]|uniref:Ralf-like 34 n=1 Tax=Hibiscus syriacus TaxID=106335 RepID=A0A6A3BGX0_HIBSY|nr:putative Ralf-like 34 [Hibiscus syriacus]
MHAKTDSEVTSLATSSSTRSPRRPVYYVQSPSRFPRLRKDRNVFPFDAGTEPRRVTAALPFLRGGPLEGAHRKGQKQWKENDVIEEEGMFEDEEREKSLPRRCYVLAFVLGFFFLFSMFSLILWGVSRPQKPKITVKSIKVEEFKIQAGSDFSGVATEMISMNSTVKFIYRNTGTFFGVHMKSSHQSRKSLRCVPVTVMGNKVPMYGGGASLSSSTGTSVSISFELSFVVRTKTYVLGKLVKPKFHKKIECVIPFDPKKLNVPISLKKSCTCH